MKKILRAIALAATFSTSAAFAQSNPGLTYGQVPTAGQWNSYFSSKQDTLGYTPLNVAGGIMLGRLVTATVPAGTSAGFNLTPGATPPSPVNGDLWTTNSGLFARINGATVGPFTGPTAANFAAVAPLAVSFPASVTTYALNYNSTLTASGGNLGLNLANLNTWSGAQGFAGGITVSGSFVAPGLVTNAALANSALTIGSTSVALGATASTVAGLTLTAPTINGGTANALTGLSVRSTGAAFNLLFASSEVLTANRTLSVVVGDANKTLSLGGNLTVAGATSLPVIAQGDLWYGSAAGVVSALAKDANATRYLANTGASNNPAWAQVNLANGVTGSLPLTSIAAIAADNVLGNPTGSSAAPQAMPLVNCANALTYNTATHAFGCNVSGGTGTVTSVTLANAGGIALSGTNPITSTGTINVGLRAPTMQSFTSGTSLTYTTPAGVAFIRVLGCAGGGGGGGSGTGVTAGNGNNGNSTSFGTLSATGGSGSNAGSGGSAQGGVGSGAQINYRGNGGTGTYTLVAGQFIPRVPGGSSPLFGGSSGTPENGAGGASGTLSGAGSNGGSGGAGGCFESIIASPAASYVYTVGTGGTGGIAGTSGTAGIDGAPGKIVVWEY